MQFVQKRAQKSTNIVLGCEVVARTTSLQVDFVQKLAYHWLLRFCGLRPGLTSFTILVCERIQHMDDVTGVFVVLCEETERDCGHGAVTPRSIQAAE